jgi:hypothetical protein
MEIFIQKIRTLLVASLLCFSANMQAQYRELMPIVDKTEYQSKGWFFAPGITLMLPTDADRIPTRVIKPNGVLDTLYSGVFNGKSRVGLYLEGGRHHFTDKFIGVHSWDYGIHIKMLRGRETFDGQVKVDTTLLEVNNTGKFSQTFAGAFVNASNILRLNNAWYIQNSLGLNADFRVLSRINYQGPTTGMPQEYPNWMVFQLHYKLGFCWKADPGLYFMPSIETPVLSLYPFDDGKSTMQYFSTRYRPIIISVRVMFLDKRKGRSCENQPGHMSEIDAENPGKHKKSDIFGREVNQKKMRKHRGRK